MNTLGDSIHIRTLDRYAPDLLHEPPEWTFAAVCASTDPEAFFPEKGGSTAEAKKVCRGCPVRTECLEYALDNNERFGIWGGLSERERRRLGRTWRPGDPVPEVSITRSAQRTPCSVCGLRFANLTAHQLRKHGDVAVMGAA